MHEEYSQTVSTTVMGTLFGSPFVLEIMNIADCTNNFCWMKTAAVAALALFILKKSKVWQSKSGVAVGAAMGFISPFVAHLYLLFM